MSETPERIARLIVASRKLREHATMEPLSRRAPDASVGSIGVEGDVVTEWMEAIDALTVGPLIIGAFGDSEPEARSSTVYPGREWLRKMADAEAEIEGGVAAGVGAPEGQASGCDPDRCEWWRRFNSGYYAEPVAPADGPQGER